MAAEENEEFERGNICWICGKLIDDNKVRDNCHITGKYRGCAHWNCKINLTRFWFGGGKNYPHKRKT